MTSLREPIKNRIDPLIAERAPWLYAGKFYSAPARRIMERTLSYEPTLALGEELRDQSTEDLMGRLGDLLAQDLEITGLQNIPRQRPALIVANHPTGIADGIMLHHVLKPIRPEMFIYANADILKVMPQMEDLIVPVEWRLDKRSHSKTRATMAGTRAALERGAMGVIFPSGRLAKRRGLQLYERPWMSSAAMIARKFDLDVIPVHIQARNSVLFYLLDLLHPTLRDITLFYETLNKNKQPYRITVGEPISASALPRKSDEAIDLLRRATLALGGQDAPAVSLVRSSRKFRWA